MKKILKLIFSRYIWIALLLVIQVVFIGVCLEFLKSYSLIVNFVVLIADIVVFFKIINRKESSEYKIPWIVIILFFPFVGILFYVLFRNHGMSKKQFSRIKECETGVKQYLVETDEEKERYLTNIGDAKPHFDYLRATNYKGHFDNHVEYFPLGELYFADMIEHLKKAEKFIFIEFFIIDKGQIWNEIHAVLKEKAAKGVDVRIMFDDVGTLGKIGYFDRRKLRKEGIKVTLFNPLKVVVSGRYNYRDHRKIVIIDHLCAYTGGNNLADEYANKITRFGHWKDTGVRIEGSAINNLLALYLTLWDYSTKTKSDYKDLMDYEYPKFDEPGYVLPFGDGPVPYYKDQIGEGMYCDILANAKHYVYISSPYFIPTNALMTAITNAARRGVKVKLMLPGIPDKKSAYNMARSHFAMLNEIGVDICIYKPGFNHNKCVLCDDEICFDGTINFDYRSLVHHFECGILMYKAPCIMDIKKDFEETFAKCEKPKKTKFAFGPLFGVLNIFRTMF